MKADAGMPPAMTASCSCRSRVMPWPAFRLSLSACPFSKKLASDRVSSILFIIFWRSGLDRIFPAWHQTTGRHYSR